MELSREDLKEFLNEYVTIAIPHLVLDRPFFHTGILTEVDDYYITIKIKDGYKQISINDILEIRRLQ